MISRTSVLALLTYSHVVCLVCNLVVGWKTLEYISLWVCNAIALWLAFPAYAC